MDKKELRERIRDLAEMFAQAVYEAYEYCLVW